MNSPRLAFGTVFLGFLLIGTLRAQAESEWLNFPDHQVQPSAAPYYDHVPIVPVSDPGPAAGGDVPPPPPPPPQTDSAAALLDQPAPAAPPSCEPPKPWKIPQPCFLQNHGITMGGWIEQGITGNAWNPADRFNGPVALNDRSGEYQLNQLWLFFDRPTKTDGCGWDIGGHIDLAYGTDWRYGKCIGLEDRFDSPNSFYGLILPQFFASVAYNDWTVDVGHYAANFGYENVPAVANFFYSHDYAISYGEPILVTGARANYKLSERWSLTGGINRGWEMFEDINGAVDFLGGIRYDSCDKRTSLKWMTSVGAEDPLGTSQVFVYALTYEHKLNEKLQYVLQHDLGNSTHGNPRTGGAAQWYDIDQYLLYTINKKWSAGLRAEWFQDTEGSRVAGIGNFIGSGRGWQGLPGFAGNFYEVTAGLNWHINPNCVLRPEVRYDFYDGSRNIAGQLPFNNGNNSYQFLYATDLVVTF